MFPTTKRIHLAVCKIYATTIALTLLGSSAGCDSSKVIEPISGEPGLTSILDSTIPTPVNYSISKENPAGSMTSGTAFDDYQAEQIPFEQRRADFPPELVGYIEAEKMEGFSLSPDGRWLALQLEPGFTLYDIARRQHHRLHAGDREYFYYQSRYQFHRDGHILALASEYDGLTIWDLRSTPPRLLASDYSRDEDTVKTYVSLHWLSQDNSEETHRLITSGVTGSALWECNDRSLHRLDFNRTITRGYPSATVGQSLFLGKDDHSFWEYSMKGDKLIPVAKHLVPTYRDLTPTNRGLVNRDLSLLIAANRRSFNIWRREGRRFVNATDIENRPLKGKLSLSDNGKWLVHVESSSPKQTSQFHVYRTKDMIEVAGFAIKAAADKVVVANDGKHILAELRFGYSSQLHVLRYEANSAGLKRDKRQTNR